MLITIKPLRWMDKYDVVKRACDAVEFMKELLEYGSMQLSTSLATSVRRLLSPTSRPRCQNQQLALNCALAGAEKVFRAAETQAEPPAPPLQIKNLQQCGAGGSACQGLFQHPVRGLLSNAANWGATNSVG
jgi:hypothetical protein